MKTFKVNENSFSYKWNSHLFWKWNDDIRIFKIYPKDFCTYWRHTLLWSPIVLIVYLFVSISVIAITCMLIYGIIFSTKEVFSGMGFLLALFAMISGLSWGLSWVDEKYGNYLIPIFDILNKILGFPFKLIWNYGLKQILIPIFDKLDKMDDARLAKKLEKSKRVKETGMIKMWYKSFKEKYCPMVEYNLEKSSQKT